MEQTKITDFEAVLAALKEGAILKDTQGAYYVSHRQKVSIFAKGNRFVLSLADFTALYREESFYLAENKEWTVDLKKDEEYYNFKRK